MKPSLNQSVMKSFSVLVRALGIDENDLLDYLNWCLLEHLVATLSSDKDWVAKLRVASDGMAQFKAEVERRTRLKWDVENVAKLYHRVLQANERHYRQPITYEELLRLLINCPLKCANLECGKAPPEVKLHIDHIFPASRGGGSKFENLRFLCQKCNLSKSAKLTRSKIWVSLESLRPF
jgi:5-methylcytosine-specific restriction endonuclease McrA